ncbi:PAS domain S-box protein [Ancylothrix sp. C2]|uniref:PAS domain S-box protein n=1 Tax=Ancylothrix sp. D3o TaxID=2953691 RepID=UPI0021BB4812|nr:PAS domain S-box protein [Ancylothrix sp. D3o]MCT7951514.1 PAS domain S-box protein [Ancylothrix sp. D3o]
MKQQSVLRGLAIVGGMARRPWFVWRVLPLVVGVGVLSASVGLGRAIKLREAIQIQQTTSTEVAVLASELHQEMQQRILALVRLAQRGEKAPKYFQENWQADAQLYLEHFEGYDSIWLVDSSFKIRSGMPVNRPEAATNLKHLLKQNGAECLKARSGEAKISPTMNKEGKGPQFFVCVPIIKAQNLTGFVVGVFKAKEVFKDILHPKIAGNYAQIIYEGNKEIYRQNVLEKSKNSDFIKSARIEFEALDWRLEVWPNQKLLSEQKSQLPLVVWGAGTFLSLMAGGMVHLAQKSKFRAWEVEEINQQLQHEIFQRHQVEKFLREQESMLRSFYDSAPMMMGVVEIVGEDILHISDNATTADFFGTTTEAMHLKLASEMGVSEENRQKWVSYYLESERKSAPVRFEYFHDTEAGRRWLSVTVCPIFREADSHAQFSYIVEDVTERVQMEEAIKASQSRLSLIYNTVSDLIFLMKVEENNIYECVSVNKAYLEATGLKEEDLIGKKIEEIAGEGAVNFVLSKYQEAVRQAVPLQYEETADVPKGYLIFETTLTPIFNEAGICTHLLGASHDITRRKLVEEKLRFSEDRWQLALRGNNDGIWDWNIENNETFFSVRWKEMLGYEDKEIPNQLDEWAKRVHPEDIAPVKKLLEEHFAKKTPFYISEHRILCKDGSYKWILDRGQAVWNQQGNPVRMVGSHTDITDRKRTEESLKLSEERYRRLVDLCPDGIYVAQKEIIKFVNSAAVNILGCVSEKDLVGKSIFNFIHPDYRLIAQQRLHKLEELQQDTPLLLQKYLRLDGKTVDVEVAATSIEINGELACLVVLRDITERQETMMALRESERFIQRLADSTPNILYLYDIQENRNLYINREVLGSLGYTPEEVKQMNGVFMDHLMHPEDLQKLPDYFKHFFAAREGEIFEFEYRLQHKSGEWRRFLSRDTVFTKTADGKAKEILGTATDITDRKEVEEKWLQLNHQLTNWVNELEDRNEEITLLSHTSDLLQACLTLEEAFAVITQMMPVLFPNSSGGIFKISESRNLVEAKTLWGNAETTHKIFAPHDCMALRRGQPHLVEDPQKNFVCKHLVQPAPQASFCIPMMAAGEATGVFYFSYQDKGQLTKAKQQLAVTVARQVSMALANLQLHETLQNQSIRDPLTGLFNRRYLEESLDREIHRAIRSGQPLSVIMLDVDHFKQFNDSFGHDAGDAVLRELGIFLQSSIRSTDIACRYGGEEFTLIFPESCLESTRERAEDLRIGVKNLQVQHRRQFLERISLSLGVACFPTHGTHGELLIRSADAALYRAKKQGRDCTVTAS